MEKKIFGGGGSLINLAITFLVIMDIIVTAVNNEPSQRF